MRTETSSCWATSQERSSCSISNPRTAPHGCTGEACDMRDNYERFLALGYEVVGVSRDSATSHQRFRAKCQMLFHHISDPDHLILEAHEAWGDKKNCGKNSMTPSPPVTPSTCRAP